MFGGCGHWVQLEKAAEFNRLAIEFLEGDNRVISSLGYLRVESADPGAWREFGLKILGMTEGSAPKGGGPEPNVVYLRMDDFPARLVIVPGSADRLLASGWEVADAAALAAVGRALANAGVPYKAGADDELAAGRVGAMLTAEDAGHQLEFFCGAALDSRPSVSPYGNRFVTGDLGLGHVVLPVPAGDEAAFGFYTEVLGFRLRDSMRMPAEFFGGKPGDPRSGSASSAATRGTTRWPWRRCPPTAGIVHLMIEPRRWMTWGGRWTGAPGAGHRYRARWGRTPTT